MDIRIKAFQEATDTFAYLARLDLAALKQKLGDERLVDGMQNGRAQKYEYTTELCWKAIKFFLKEKEGAWMKPPPKRSSKHTSSMAMPRKTIICCCFRQSMTKIASAICMTQQRLTTFLGAFPIMPRSLSESARN